MKQNKLKKKLKSKRKEKVLKNLMRSIAAPKIMAQKRFCSLKN